MIFTTWFHFKIYDCNYSEIEQLCHNCHDDFKYHVYNAVNGQVNISVIEHMTKLLRSS